MTLIKRNKANVIIDGQWGSTGKGLLAGYLYDRYPSILAGVCDFMPNAGHTVHLPNGTVFVSRHVPIAAAYGRMAFIGPHAAIDMNTLKNEMRHLRDCRSEPGEVYVHPLASVISPDDLTAERIILGRIASTQKGGHASTARKTMRTKDASIAGDYKTALREIGVNVADTHECVQRTLAHGGTVLIETAQGFDLGLNHGKEWPYVTGRDCLVGRALDNAGVPIRDCGSVIGCMRTFPIRVGNTDNGNSGPHYEDQRELTWEQVSEIAGEKIEERTTVTNRVRRVFTFSDTQARRFFTFVRPDYLFLNFWNQTNAEPQGERSKRLWHIKALAAHHGCQLRLIGTGPKSGDVIDLEDPTASQIGVLHL
jgi:adenylosuccinate synthase